MEAVDISAKLSRFEQLRHGREVLRVEGEALLGLSQQLQFEFCDAVELLFRCSGCVITTGMGKAGLIGQKVAASFGSTGTTSHFLHPGEAIHGDLGRIHANDSILAFSFSGETEEVVRLLPSLRDMQVPLIAVTGHARSSLGKAADVVLELGSLEEACSLGLAPSTSTTAMLAIGDALALVLSRMRQFGREDFARFHPGGSLGRKLAKVDEVMRQLSDCRLAADAKTVREVLVQTSKPARRTGATMLTDSNGVLAGVFTDSDLARMLENKRETELDGSVRVVMTKSPCTIMTGSLLSEAVAVMTEHKISELPVVDADGRPLGMIDITDVMDLMPAMSKPAVTVDSHSDQQADPVILNFPDQGTTGSSES